MPMFQWNAGSDADVVSQRIWIYWAVTIPLTLLTFLAWILWIQYRHEGKVSSRWATTSTQPAKHHANSADASSCAEVSN